MWLKSHFVRLILKAIIRKNGNKAFHNFQKISQNHEVKKDFESRLNKLFSEFRYAQFATCDMIPGMELNVIKIDHFSSVSVSSLGGRLRHFLFWGDISLLPRYN